MSGSLRNRIYDSAPPTPINRQTVRSAYPGSGSSKGSRTNHIFWPWNVFYPQPELSKRLNSDPAIGTRNGFCTFMGTTMAIDHRTRMPVLKCDCGTYFTDHINVLNPKLTPFMLCPMCCAYVRHAVMSIKLGRVTFPEWWPVEKSIFPFLQTMISWLDPMMVNKPDLP